MPNIKLALTIEEMKLLEKEAEKEHLSVQDFIRYKLFSTRCSQIFTPEEAERRALEKFQRTHSSIVFVKMTPDGRRALYKIEKKEDTNA